MHDGAGLFEPADMASMEERLATLSRETAFEVRVESREFPGFDGFQAAAEEIFEGHVARLGHYRLALVLIGVDRQGGRGMVGTNLGAGLYQVMSREEAADLFLAEGEPFSVARIRGGVERLAARLEEWHTMKQTVDERLFTDGKRSWYEGLGVPVFPLAALGLVGMLVAWLAWKARFCPECGSKMRTRMRLGGPGGRAVRTSKCFDCGHVQKTRYEPGGFLGTVLGGGGRRRSAD